MVKYYISRYVHRYNAPTGKGCTRFGHLIFASPKKASDTSGYRWTVKGSLVEAELGDERTARADGLPPPSSSFHSSPPPICSNVRPVKCTRRRDNSTARKTESKTTHRYYSKRHLFSVGLLHLAKPTVGGWGKREGKTGKTFGGIHPKEKSTLKESSG